MNFLFPIVATIALISAPACFFLFRAREHLSKELAAERAKNLVLETRKEAGEQRLQDQKQVFSQMQEQLRLEFKTTAGSLFEDISKKFGVQSEKQIGDLLNPLRERFVEFQKKVDESFGNQAKEQFSLKSEIERIVKVNQEMQVQTESLTKALRGDVKAQGNWGEVMLERILNESGLRKDKDYIVQAVGMGLKGEENNTLRPDVIINLPDGKHIIIDSKVSLQSYERYCGEVVEANKPLHLRDYLKSVRTHVGLLEQKRYQDITGLATPDFVLMFMPTEGAWSLAVQQDESLHQYAWERRIVIVSPTTLFATLRTIASLWRIESQNQNARKIAEESGKFYDKLVGFTVDLLAIGKQIGTLQTQYDKARSKLSEGTGNLIGRAEKIKKLGAKTTQSLPGELLSDEENETVPLVLVSDN